MNCLLNIALVHEFKLDFDQSLIKIQEALKIEPENPQAIKMEFRITKIMDALKIGAITLDQYLDLINRRLETEREQVESSLIREGMQDDQAGHEKVSTPNQAQDIV